MSNEANTIQVRVNTIKDEALGIRSFELVDECGGILPAFTAGSHIEVMLPGGLTRQYSLCNAPIERHRYLIAVLRTANSRGGSAAMHERVTEGDVIRISAPKNRFPLNEGARKSLLLAGGIGVTPLLSMAERLHGMSADFLMHYCTRSMRHSAFQQRIASAPYAAKVAFHFDDGDPAQKFDVKTLLAGSGPGAHLYVCGPRGFMDAVLDTARDQGWPESWLHREYFGTDAKAEPPASAGSFEVLAAKSSQLIIVPHDKTVVQALVAAGIQVPVSCEQGVCGTCLTRVLDGTPEHRDMYLTPEEQAANDQFTPCCSRSISRRLVLDL